MDIALILTVYRIITIIVCVAIFFMRKDLVYRLISVFIFLTAVLSLFTGTTDSILWFQRSAFFALLVKVLLHREK